MLLVFLVLRENVQWIGQDEESVDDLKPPRKLTRTGFGSANAK